MATTIQISEATKQVLDSLKERGHLRTHDKVIQHLFKAHGVIPKSMFGAVKKLKWNKGDRAELHEL